MKDFIRELAEQEDWTLRSSAVSATLQSLDNARMNAEIRRSAGSQSLLSGSGKRWRST